MAGGQRYRTDWHWGLTGCVASVLICSCSGGVRGDGSEASEDSRGPMTEEGQTSDVSVQSSSSAEQQTDGPPPVNSSGATSDATTDTEPPDTAQPGSVLRLTQVELNHTLRDLLGDNANTATGFLSEDEFSPFDNDAARQTVSPSLIESVHALAGDVAQRVAHDPTVRSSWMPCEPTGADDVRCFDAAVTELTQRFLRRPVSDADVAEYRRLWDLGVEAGDFYFGIELLLASLIQDPEFLYRLERPSAGALNDYEIATRLSFLLRGTTPDDALLEDAANGKLSSPVERALITRRILTSDEAKEQMYRFHSMWLGYRAIPHDAALNAAFQLETEQLLNRVIFEEPQSYLNLFQSSETYLTTNLADHYALPHPQTEPGWVVYPENSGRAGILSHGSVLSAFSKFDDTSPTQRGIFIRTRLLCQPVPPPPPAVNVDQPPGGEQAEGSCKLDRYRAHREQSGCRDCHQLFDPIGEGLERFDRAGRYREHDDADENCVIEAQGELPGYGAFDGPGELAALLSQTDAIQSCFVRHVLSYARGTSALTSADQTFATDMANAFEQTGLVLSEWLPEWVADERFVLPLEGSR